MTAIRNAAALMMLACLTVGLGCGEATGPTAGPAAETTQTEHTTVFAQVPYERAVDQATSTDKLLLVDFTATWCAPCKRMEKTTWVDPAVNDWVDQHAVAVQVDYDRNPELVKRFGIKGIPVVIVIREGEEVDRVVGYRSAEQLLAWLNGVLNGQSSAGAA